MSFKFKNTGQDLNEIRKRLSKKIDINNQQSIPLGIQTPLKKGFLQGETLFSMHFNLLDQISDNLKNLLMTQKGERLGRGNYGTNLYQIYSQTNIENPEELAIQEISNTVKSFMPQVSLSNYESKKIENSPNDAVIYEISVFYTVPAISSETKKIIINLRMTN